MIRLLKNILGNKQKERVSLNQQPNVEEKISEISLLGFEPELIIQEPEITELTEEEIQEFVQQEIESEKYSYGYEDWGTSLDIDISERDSMFREAAEVVVIAQQGSTSLIQRKLKLGYNRAGRLIDQLESAGIVGTFEGIKSRPVLIPDLVALEHFFENEEIEDNSKELKEKSIKEELFKNKYFPIWKDYIYEKSEEHNKKVLEEIEKEEIKQKLLERERKRELRERAKRELQEEGHIKATNKSNRKISQEVKDLVWNRDNGKCVQCGSNEKLEFDHIIPISKGGSNTYRNVQILCEKCNREKSNKIG